MTQVSWPAPSRRHHNESREGRSYRAELNAQVPQCFEPPRTVRVWARWLVVKWQWPLQARPRTPGGMVYDVAGDNTQPGPPPLPSRPPGLCLPNQCRRHPPSVSRAGNDGGGTAPASCPKDACMIIHINQLQAHARTNLHHDVHIDCNVRSVSSYCSTMRLPGQGSIRPRLYSGTYTVPGSALYQELGSVHR